MTRSAAPPPSTRTTLPPTPYPPDYRPPSPPFTLGFLPKAVIFFVGLWGSRKLWKMKAKTVNAVALDAYAPVTLAAADQQRIAAAKQRLDQQLAQIDTKGAVLDGEIRGLHTRPRHWLRARPCGPIA